jgi:hypothetical protein
MTSLLRDGYQVHRGAFSGEEIEDFRAEADGIGTEAGSACVRRLNERSRMFGRLSTSSRILKPLTIFP